MAEDHTAFIERVRAAFPDAGCPPDWLPTCPCSECQELAQFLRERPKWRAFSAEDCFSAHSVTLMDRSFSYFLPAFIVASLVDEETADVAVDFAAWRFLTDPPHNEPNIELLSAFSVEQRAVILEWLSWYADTRSVDEDQQRDYRQQIENLRSSAG